MRDDEAWMREALFEAHNCLHAPGSTSQAPDVTYVADSIQPSLQTSDSLVAAGLASVFRPNNAPTDVPVGAICVFEGRVIGRGHNRRELDRDPTAHAETLALRTAAQHLDDWRLGGVTLYVTLEPCAMCAGAIWLARVERVVFGAWDARAGACGSLFDITRDPRLNHRPQVRGGVLENECAALLNEFFARQRRTSG